MKGALRAGGAALLLAVAGWGGWSVWRPEPPRPDWRSAVLERGPLEAVVAATGTVNPVLQVNVGSQVSGQLAAVLADFNTEVREGQVIARLDPKTFELRVGQAKADLEAARATARTAGAAVAAAEANAARARLDAANARRDLERRQGLLAEGFISPADFDTSRNQAETLAEAARAAEAQVGVSRAQDESARAAIAQRQSVLAQAEVDLGRTVIRSPVDGVVIKRSISVGQTVAASLQAPELFIIARNLADMQVEVSVDEADIGRITPGLAASFTVDAHPGLTVQGQVAQVRKAATTQQNVVTYTTVVRFRNDDGRLLPGMTANVRIATERREDALKLPNAALRVRVPEALLPPGAAAAASGAGSRPEGAGRRPGGAPAAEASAAPRQPSRGRVWRLRADGQVEELRLRLGLSDGQSTEVLDSETVTPGGAPLAAGDALLIASPAAPAGGGGLGSLFGGANGPARPAAAPRAPF